MDGMVTTGGHPLALHNLLYLSAMACGTTMDDLRGPSQIRALVTARRIFAKKARSEGFSFPTIGRILNRHHTTILHLVRT